MTNLCSVLQPKLQNLTVIFAHIFTKLQSHSHSKQFSLNSSVTHYLTNMDSTRTDFRIRTEANHTEYSNSPSPSPYKNNITANKHLILNSAYSEPIPHQSRIINHKEETENIPPHTSSSFQFKSHPNSTSNHTQSQSQPFDDRILYKENMIKEEDDADNDSELDSEPEPSPTPIVSDLDDLLADNPNIYSNSNDSSISPTKSLNLNINISQPSSINHGISIPYNVDDEDSDTPEPLDTPQTPGNGSHCNFDNICYNQNVRSLNINVDITTTDDDTKLDEEDMILSDLDEFNIDGLYFLSHCIKSV